MRGRLSIFLTCVATASLVSPASGQQQRGPSTNQELMRMSEEIKSLTNERNRLITQLGEMKAALTTAEKTLEMTNKVLAREEDTSKKYFENIISLTTSCSKNAAEGKD